MILVSIHRWLWNWLRMHLLTFFVHYFPDWFFLWLGNQISPPFKITLFHLKRTRLVERVACITERKEQRDEKHMKLISILLEERPCCFGHEINEQRICCQDVNNSSLVFQFLLKAPLEKTVMTLGKVKPSVFSDRSTFVLRSFPRTLMKMPYVYRVAAV